MNLYKELVDVLDSDDEFPDEYSDTAYLPAYKNDFRFNPIDFKWIHNKTKNQVAEERNSYLEDRNKINVCKINNTSEPYLVLRKGILKKQDIYCLKAVANSTAFNIVLWLTNFMLVKDLQSRYSFLTSCLVTR